MVISYIELTREGKDSMMKGFRVKILPNNDQAINIIKFCHASRFAYNWALSIEIDNHEKGYKFISGYELTKLFTQYKKQEGNEWLKEISGRALKIAILNCACAYQNFFEKQSQYPKFKTKKNSKMKCATHEGTIVFESNRVRLEKLGWVKLSQKDRVPYGEGTKYSNPKIEYDGVDFWISVSVEVERLEVKNSFVGDVIGIDLGIKTLVTMSNGDIEQKPNIKKEKKKLKKLQQRISKHYLILEEESERTKIKFNKLSKSKNLIKLEKKLCKQYIRIQNILNTNIHEFTTHLIKSNPRAIVIEDLSVRDMLKNKYLADKIREAKFYEIRRQLAYKCNWNDIELIVVDRWYPSSKTCSVCGHKKLKLSLGERIFNCESCGATLDRDLNASINLKNLFYAT